MSMNKYQFHFVNKGKKKRGTDQSAAFGFGRSELLDGLNEGNNESKASVREGNSEDPRQGGGAHTRPRNGLGDGAGELN